MNISDNDLEQLNEWEGFLSIKPTWLFEQFIHRHENTLALFTGNQWGKNVNIVKQYIMRWLGIHPIEAKNMRPFKKIRTYRFCSETLPNDPEAGDKNTIYPVLKRLLPKSLIKKDITARNSIVTIKDIQGGDDIYIEFVSYKQDVQAGAGVQRASIYLDENCNRAFYEEQLPRLLASDGDLIVGMTPALGQITWQYEDIYEQAKTIIRTQAVIDRYEKRFGEKIPLIKSTGLTNDTCVLMAATDDNPFYDTLVSEKNAQELKLIELGQHPFYSDIKTFKPITKSQYIANKLELIDEETEDVRRFGIFRQISGRIFKDFDVATHVINKDKVFPDGIPHDWFHARGIDYHPHVDWHCGFVAMSPGNEMFIYNELKISPEKHVTHEIANVLCDLSGDYKYRLNLIDPLSAEKQPNTGTSPVEDLNRIFHEYQKEGRCANSYWTSWDTKSLKGRDEIKKRLKNSKIVGKPFVNNGLPTLWILDNCKNTIESFKNWKLEEWGNRASLETHEIKEKPQQKWSHMNMVWEAICKHPAWRPRKEYQEVGGFKERHTYNDKMRIMR